MRVVTKVNAVFDRVIYYAATFAVVLLAVAWLLVCVSVFLRYFLGGSIPWSSEVTEYILVAIPLLAAAWLLKKEGHIKIDIVVNRLNPRNQAVVNMVTSVLCIILWLVITWYSVEALWISAQKGLGMAEHFLSPPKWAVHAVIPVGSLLLTIQFIRRSSGYLRSWREHHQIEKTRGTRDGNLMM